MWCSSCQQDVPALPSSEDGASAQCLRCRQPFHTGRPSPVKVAVQMPPTVGPPKLVGDDWRLDSDLRSVDRLVKSLRADAYRPVEPAPLVPPAMIHSPSPSITNNSATTKNSPQRGGLLIWAVLSLGVMTFVCGGVLLAWSFATDRADLRTLGLPLTLVGQAGLIIGLVLQLEGLWQSNRQTRETLDELDSQLGELRHATTLMSTSHSSSGQSFYAHMAEGASPHLLLADVKGQLDLLAQRMASQR